MRTRPASAMILGVILAVAVGVGTVYAQEGAPPVEPAVPDCVKTPMGPFPPVCRHEAAVGRIVTVDLTVPLAPEETMEVELPLGGIRYSGAIVQVYYNSAMGKSEWFILPSLAGVVIFPDNVQLPMARWVASGLAPGTIVRVVALIPAPGQ